MGCTVSCHADFIAENKSPSSSSSPTRWTSQLISSDLSFSDLSCGTPVSRAFSLPTPLIHHPPLRKGDSNHFVSLTSSTYGSLVLIDHPPNSGSSSRNFDNITEFTEKTSDFCNPEDPLSPDSVINTWELMEGLDEEEFDFHMVDHPSNPSKTEESLDRSNDFEKPKTIVDQPKRVDDLVSERDDCYRISGASDRIVLYYTSLRGIRKTYEDCCFVRVIFRGLSVYVDERDISMDRSYRKELKEALKGKEVSLPQVFIRGKHIGGAEEIKQLNETGELANLVQGFSLVDRGFVCSNCGDVRFVPCSSCSGSRKVYDEEEGALIRCPDCNENGLTRCPVCCL